MKHLSDNELINYISGKLSDDWNKQVERHLNHCTECQETSAFLQEMHDEWEMPLSSPSSNFTDNLMVKIQAEMVEPGNQPQAPKVIELKKTAINKNMKYLHFGLAAAAMILFSQVGLGELVKEKSENFVGSSSKKMTQATITFTEGIKTVNKLTEKQFKKMEEQKNEKTK
jgi:anti-sigma factor RsiW